MAIETRNKTIDGHQVMVTQYPGTTSLTNKVRILKLLGPGVGETLSKVSPEEATAGVASSKLEIFIQVLGNVCGTLDPDKFTEFVLELLIGTRIKVGGTSGDYQEITREIFDLEFAGQLLLMYKILFFVLEVNYGNFFGKGGLGEFLKRKQPISPAIRK